MAVLASCVTIVALLIRESIGRQQFIGFFNYCEKRRKCWITAFFIFPALFYRATFLRFLKIHSRYILENRSTVMLSTIPYFLVVYPYPNKLLILHVCSLSLLKTMWEKEKLLVTSHFSFFPLFSTSMEKFLPFS